MTIESPSPQSPKGLPKSKVWSEPERAYALAVYAETRSTYTASQVTGIPHTTIQYWIRSEDGAETIRQLRQVLRERCGWKYANLVNQSLDLLGQRLSQGDPHVLQGGTIVYKPVSARDLMMIAAVSTDKHSQIVGTLDDGQQVDKALNNLANKLLEKLAIRGEAKAQRSPIVSSNDPDNSPYVG